MELNNGKELSKVDNFQIVYKILSALEKAMDYPEFDISQIDAQTLKISQERWARYIEMLVDTGFIKGVRIFENVCGETQIQDNGIRITLKGLEYLTENSLMKRVYKAVKGIKEISPSQFN